MTVEYLSNISQALIALTSLIVSIIALRLSKKITLKRNLKDLQFDLIIELINNFSNETLFIHYKEIGGKESTSMTTFPEFKSTLFKKDYEHLFKPKYFLLTNSTENAFNFLRNRWNPLMPKSISKELKKFSTYGKLIHESELHSLKEYVFIDISPNGKVENYYLLNTYTDFESFYIYINSIMDKINKWLDNHDTTDVKFDGEE